MDRRPATFPHLQATLHYSRRRSPGSTLRPGCGSAAFSRVYRSFLSFPPVPSVVVGGGWRPLTPRGSEFGFRTRQLPLPRSPWRGQWPASLPRPSAALTQREPGARQAATPTVGCGPHRPHPAPPTHKDSRCLSCCSCCASCRRRFCSRRRCSSCSGGSRGRRDPAPDDIATRGGLRRWKVTSSAPQRNPTDVPPARAAERRQGTRCQAPAALRPAGT